MPVCEGCGSSFDDGFKFCPQCGRVKPEAKKINIEVDIKPRTSPYDCPLCEDAANVQKVSAIVASGTAEGSGHSISTGSTDFYSTASGKKVVDGYSTSTSSSSSFQQSQLAQKVNLPKPPWKPKSSAWDPGNWTFGIVGLLVLFVMGAIYDEVGEGLVFFIIGGLVLWVVVTIQFANLVNKLNHSAEKDKKSNEAYQAELNIYEQAKVVWENLYYCHKHDVVFCAGLNHHMPVEKSWAACLEWRKDFPKQTSAK